MKNLFASLVVGVILTGCSSLGLTPPQNLDQQLAYAYSGVTAALQSIATATTNGQMSSANAEKANAMVLQVRATLDAARAIEATDGTSAQKDLQLATASLTAVQQFLTQNGVK